MVSLQRLSRGGVLERPEGSYISTGLTVADTNRVPRDQLQGLAQSMGVSTPATLATVSGYSNTFFLTTAPLAAVVAVGPEAVSFPTSPLPRQPGWAAPILLANPGVFREIARVDGTPGLTALFNERIATRPDLEHLTWEDVGTTWDLYSSSGDSSDQERGFGGGSLIWAVPLGPSPSAVEAEPEVEPPVTLREPSPFEVNDVVYYKRREIDDRPWLVTAVRETGFPDPFWVVDLTSIFGVEDFNPGVNVFFLEKAIAPGAEIQPSIPSEVLEGVDFPESASPFEVNDVVYYKRRETDDRPWLVTAVRQTGFPDPFWVVDLTSIFGVEDFRQGVNVFFLEKPIAPGLEFEPTIGDLSEVTTAISAVPVAVAREVGPIITAGSDSILSVLEDLGGLIEGIEIPDLLAVFPGLATLGEFLANPLEYVLTRGGEITISPDIRGQE